MRRSGRFSFSASSPWSISSCAGRCRSTADTWSGGSARRRGDRSNSGGYAFMTLFGKIGRLVLGLLACAALAGGLGAGPAKATSVDDILGKKKLVVGVLTDFPPFGGTDANQKPDGYDADVAKLMAKALGVDLELVPVTGPNRIPYLLTNKVDVLIATFGITPERAKQVQFSIPYSSLDIYLLAPKKLAIKGPQELKHLKIPAAQARTQDAAISAFAPKGRRIRRLHDTSEHVIRASFG